MRCRHLASVLGLATLLGACAAVQSSNAARSPSWALNGFAVVGHVVRVEPAEIWEGDVAQEGGHVIWFETLGPSTETISFGSLSDCPSAEPGADQYIVVLNPRHVGYVSALSPEELPALFVTSCAKVDSRATSQFTDWRRVR